MNSSKLLIFKSILILFLYLFMTFNLLLLSLSHVVLLIGGAFILSVCLMKFSLYPADIGRVEAILGSTESESGRLKVVAHRACGLDAPENSIGALEKVIKEGICAVEFDVSLSSDNIPIVFHDDTLTRMTDDTRRVVSVPYKELIDMNISDKDPRGNLFPGEKIPSFEKYVEYCLKNNIRMFIDLKGNAKGLVNVITDAFKKYPQLLDLAVISSFNPILVYKIRASDPRIVGCLAWRPYFYSHREFSAKNGAELPRSVNPFHQIFYRLLNLIHEWLIWNVAYHFIGLSAVLLHKDMISSKCLLHWKKRNIRVIAWTVNLPSEKIYFERCLQIPYLTDTLIRS